jgi:hypothetical protein
LWHFAGEFEMSFASKELARQASLSLVARVPARRKTDVLSSRFSGIS